MLPSPPESSPNALSSPLPARVREASGPGTASRVSTLWEAIRRTRVALDLRRTRVARLTDRFASTIRPREEIFTRTVCRLTERLMTHHESTALDVAGRTLLGLWIEENLRSLVSHPFAPRAETAALTRRWRGHLDRALHPLDVARDGTDTASVGRGNAARHGSARAEDDERAASSAGQRVAGEAGAARRTRDARSGWRTRDPAEGAHGRASDEDGSRTEGERPADTDGVTTAATIDRDMRALSARLFRRLARALHPDREQDEALKGEKHRLMSECLRAREERDIDTLLSLYVTHVGELPDALADGGTDALERLLRDQLHGLQRRLRHARGGDALQAMIVDRYAVDDPRESERRFGEHARALDGESARAESTIRRVAEPDGLLAALEERREKELDRLWIDEMTGVSPF